MLFLLLTGAAPPDAASIDGVPHRRQPTGPGCVAAAASMVLAHEGREIDPLELLRKVPVYPDGVSLFDMQDAIGVPSVVFTDQGDWKGLVASGEPVIAIVASSAGSRARHAVVITGFREGVVERLDPASPNVREEPADAFEGRFAGAGRAAMVITPPELPDRIVTANRHFRARELARRGGQHTEPNEQMLALFAEAAKLAPDLPELVDVHALVLFRLGRKDEARAVLEAGLADHPDDPLLEGTLRTVSGE